jgi:2-methylisocitrate lyase-like PEP mutase family enzyme
MAGPGTPSVPDLAALGVARVSLGSAVAQAAYATARRATEHLLSTGTYDPVSDAIPFPELNSLLTARR